MKVVSRITDLLEEREVEKILFVEAGDREKVRAGDGDVVVTVSDVLEFDNLSLRVCHIG